MVMGSAFDILSAAWPPRTGKCSRSLSAFLSCPPHGSGCTAFVNYPLGHQAGRPFDPEDQLQQVGDALKGLEQHTAPGQVNVLDAVWGDTTDYCAEVGSSRDAVRQVRDEVTRYQAAEDLEAAVAALGEAEAGGVVSEEAVRQHAVFASK